jgi:formylglycine-generating enzyme required for sulfatase activity
MIHLVQVGRAFSKQGASMTTFISYSRVHSAFVVRLAKDLKTAGFDVWLDQLDIPKGARWDDDIEAAVERSSTFMIVLAPESMESQNVKDELSYAIDAGKYILPVVIKPCKIPLRLRRFQYVDFTDKPYKDSLADIKHLLSHMQQIAKAVEEKTHNEQATLPFREPIIPLVEPASAPAPEPEPLETADRFTPQKGLDKRIPLILMGVLGLAAVAAIAVFALGRSNSAAPPLATLSQTPELPTLTATQTPTPLPSQYTDDHGVTLRLVSAGEFVMGADDGASDDAPVHKLFLDNFYIDKYEVTNELYKACVDAGACQPPKKDASMTRAGYYSNPEFEKYPVVYVDWDMARKYCTWRGARLPTEAEWEKAARGTDGRIYPWGNNIECNEANYSGCQADTASVISFEDGLSPYEVFNLAGNVYEWVSSLFMNYPYDTTHEDLMAPGERVIRGGSVVDSLNEARSTFRQKADPSTTREDIGFRCVDIIGNSTRANTLVTVTPTKNPAATADAGTKRALRTQEGPGSGPISESTISTGPTQPIIASVTLAAATTPVPPDTDTLVPPDTDTPVPPDTDTPIPDDTDTPVPDDTDTPEPPTPLPDDTDTPEPPIVEPVVEPTQELINFN